MASPRSFTALLIVSAVLLAIVMKPAAARHIGHKNDNEVDKKEPELFFGGIGKLKHKFGFLPQYPPVTGFLPPVTGGSFPSPSTGGIGGAGEPGGRSYVPGGDDTFVPNPGFEVPIPGGGVPATPNP